MLDWRDDVLMLYSAAGSALAHGREWNDLYAWYIIMLSYTGGCILCIYFNGVLGPLMDEDLSYLLVAFIRGAW